jgi:hypothetical protein
VNVADDPATIWLGGVIVQLGSGLIVSKPEPVPVQELLSVTTTL